MVEAQVIKDGDLLFMVYDRKRQWLRKVIKGEQFHSDRGYLKFDEVIGSELGQTFLLTPHNHKIALLPPLPSDIIFHMKRESQIIYPEDIGLILIYGKIRPGSQILEAGCGSGTVTGIMGVFVGENGKINSYDIRDNAIKQALKNVDLMGVRDRVSIENGDICEKMFDHANLDFILLDMATPWLAIPKVKNYLNDSGIICCFSPTIEQIKKDYNALLANNFQSPSVFELLTRHFQVKPNATRPVGRMVAHTGYLMFASRKEGALISKDYHDRYSAENIGYLLVYAGIRPKSKVILLTSAESPLPNIMKKIFTSLDDFIVVVMLSDSSEQELDVALKSYNLQISPESMDCVLIDNITRKTLVDEVKGYVKNGGSIAVLSQFIEHMKSLHIQMAVNHFYEITSCELMKREIIIEKTGLAPESTLLGHTGYITIGRKVKDTIVVEEKKPTGEVVENLLEVGLDFADSLPEEPDEIDYANLEENEND